MINQNVCEAILVWRGHEGRSGWELGLELQNAAGRFLGRGFLGRSSAVVAVPLSFLREIPGLVPDPFSTASL